MVFCSTFPSRVKCCYETEVTCFFFHEESLFRFINQYYSKKSGGFRLGVRLTVGNKQFGVAGTFKPNFEKTNQPNSLKLNNNLFYSKYSCYSTVSSSNVQEAAKNILENSEIATLPTVADTKSTLSNSSTVLNTVTEEAAKRDELEKIINQLQQATEVIGSSTVDPLDTFDISKWYHFFARGLVTTYEISQPYMGWWFLILATAGLIRVISFPMNLISMKYYCKSKLEEPNIAQIRNKYMDQMAKEASMSARTKLQSQMRNETKAYLASRGIHSYQAFYSIIIGVCSRILLFFCIFFHFYLIFIFFNFLFFNNFFIFLSII